MQRRIMLILLQVGGLKVETLTQEEYDSLTGYDLSTLYVIG